MLLKGFMDYNTEKIRYISHEVKNQLSVCDLCTEILTRYCEKNNITDETILKSVKCIKNAVLLAENSVLELKSANSLCIKNYCINDILDETYNLAKVYGVNKSVDIELKNLGEKINLDFDKEKFQGVIINLVKNACEAFEDEKDKKIIIQAEKERDYITVKVSNNASPIDNPEEIFTDGFTTKSTGSGIGLYISKNNMSEMSGYLRLNKSDNISTEFEAGLPVKL